MVINESKSTDRIWLHCNDYYVIPLNAQLACHTKALKLAISRGVPAYPDCLCMTRRGFPMNANDYTPRLCTWMEKTGQILRDVAFGVILDEPDITPYLPDRSQAPHQQILR
jgi:hypothetical protein